MEIKRHGSSRFMGYTSIHFKRPSIAWDAKDGLIHIKSNNVSDFASDATHNYDISLSIDELGQLLAAALQAVPKPSVAVSAPGTD